MHYEKGICVFILQLYTEINSLTLQTAPAMRPGCSKSEEILQEGKTSPGIHIEIAPNLLSALLTHKSGSYLQLSDVTAGKSHRK